MTASREPAEREVVEAIDAELRFHFEERLEELTATGMSTEEARRVAEAEFGDLPAVRAGLVEIDMRVARRRRRREAFHLLVQDIRHAWRRLRRSPGFLLATVLTLGLGIGAVTAVFSLTDAVALRTLPYPDAGRVVRLRSALPGIEDTWFLAKGQFLEYRRESRQFSALGLYRLGGVTVRMDGGDAAYARVARVEPGVAEVLGARVRLGRPLEADETLGGGAPVALVTDRYWRTVMGSDPGAVGRRLEIDGVAYEVVGVLAQDARLPEEVEAGERFTIDFWVPIDLDPAEPARNHHVFRALGRLGPVASLESATAELVALTARFPESLPTAYSDRFMRETGFSPELTPLREDVIGGVASVLWLVLGAVGVVLLITCANVANLFLVRAETRRREVAVRGVLGAASRDLARHRLAETLLVAGVAALLGIGLAYAGIRLLVQAAPSGIPRLSEVGLTPLAVSLAVVFALAVALLFGLVPGNGNPARTLSEAGRSTTPSRRRRAVRNVLVMAQIGLCFALLSGAGLLLRSFAGLTAVDPGFEHRGVLTFGLVLPADGYPDGAATATFYREFANRLEGLPGVESVGAGSSLPLGGLDGCTGVRPQSPVDPDQGGECLLIVYTTPGYLGTLGIDVRGREADWPSLQSGVRGAVVSARLARQFWGEGDVTDRTFVLGGAEVPHTVVGVAEDIANEALDRPAADVLYVPVLPEPAPRVVIRQPTFVVRTSVVDPVSIVPAIRGVLGEMDTRIPLTRPQLLSTIVASSLSRVTFMATLLATAALIALLIGAVGIYAVVSYAVSQRRAEIGVRLALGADDGRVRRMVIGETLRIAGIGIGAGLLLTWSLGSVVASFLYGVTPTDPLTLAATGLLLAGISGLAGWVPARRALRMDPLASLQPD